jgi:hypothetical protein
VARFGQLVAGLREEGALVTEHPSEQELLAYESDPGSLAATQRTALRAHLEGCASCRSELRVLASFDFRKLQARAPASGAWLTRLAELVFGRPLAPAYALAALLAIALPAALAAGWLASRANRAGDEVPPVARTEVEAAAPADRADPLARPGTNEAPAEIASEVAPPQLVAKAPPAVAQDTPPDIAPAHTPAATAPDEAPRAAPPAPVSPGPTVPGREAAPVLIASLLPSDLPRYVPDAALAGGSLESMRIASVVRGSTRELPRVVVLAPDHVAATAEPAPSVYWYLSAPSAVPVEITLVSESDDPTPLVERWLDPPVAAGLHRLDLAEQGVSLAPGATYQVFVALVPDPERRESDAVASAAIRYAPPAGAARARLDAAPPAGRAHALAGAGYWLDAFATYTGWIEAEPDAQALRAQRAALLDQVGLGEIASQTAAASGS